MRFKPQHGMWDTPVWRTWRGMMDRCYRKTAANYHRYGGRGITVDPRWHEFEAFYADVGARPQGRTLERPKNDQPYGPNNWRWASRREQQRNTSANRRLQLNHRSLTIAEWSEMLGIGRSTIEMRIDHLGWSARKTLTTPVRR